jgi:hypothetical protein
MSNQPLNPTPPPSPASTPAKPGLAAEHPAPPPRTHSWRIPTIIAAAMVLLTLLGVGLTTTDRANASTYWMSLVPVYALLCIATAWTRKGKGGRPDRSAVLRQLFHWLAIGGAIWLDLLVRRTGEETGSAAGLNALLILALGCFLAGVHLEWTFALVGLLLSLTLLIVVKSEQYMWLLFVIGVVCIVLMIAAHRLFGAMRFRKGEPDKAAQPAQAGS